jgi:chemotaxis protein MotB
VHGIKGASAQAEMTGQQAGPHGSDRREIGTNELTGNAEALPKKRPEIRIFNRLDRTRTVGTMVLFPVTSADLDNEGRVQLSALVPDLIGKPNKIEIRAHAVRGPLPKDSPFTDNWELCFGRAKRVRDYLVAHGVDMSRIRLTLDGANEPYSHDVNQAHDARNARVEVFAVSEFSNTLKDPIEKRVGDFQPAPIGEDMTPAFPTTPEAGPPAGGHGDGGHGGHGEAGHGDAGHGGGGHGEAHGGDSHGDGHGH